MGFCGQAALHYALQQRNSCGQLVIETQRAVKFLFNVCMISANHVNLNRGFPRSLFCGQAALHHALQQRNSCGQLVIETQRAVKFLFNVCMISANHGNLNRGFAQSVSPLSCKLGFFRHSLLLVSFADGRAKSGASSRRVKVLFLQSHLLERPHDSPGIRIGDGVLAQIIQLLR